MPSPYAYNAHDAQVAPDEVVSTTTGPRFQSWISKEDSLYWFLSDPTDPANIENGHWIKAEVVDARDGFLGTTAATPLGCNTIPVAPPKLEKQFDGKYRRVRTEDAIMNMVRGNQYNAQSGRVRSKAVRYTEYLTSEGDLRLLEMSESAYQQITAKIQEWKDEAEDNDSTFDITAQPYMIRKSADGRVITMRKAMRKDGYAKIDPADWPEPSNLYEHVDAVRETVEDFLIAQGLAHRATQTNEDGTEVTVLVEGGDAEQAKQVAKDAEETDEPPAEVSTPEAVIAGVGTAMLRRALVAVGVSIPEGAKRPQLLELANDNAEAVAEAISA
jgi:hypothetical protein